jgi:hypothetical protein
MNHSKYPSQKLEKIAAASGEVVPPVFRLGDGTLTKEILTEGKRILIWTFMQDDKELASLAAWNIFPVEFGAEKGYLQLPVSTRNARSVLSGAEAWSDEKNSIIERATDYLNEIYNRYGMHDTGFTWGRVGVTPMHDIFIAPPNTPHQASEERVSAWKQTLIGELDLILRNDEVNHVAVDLFAENLRRIDGDDF